MPILAKGKEFECPAGLHQANLVSGTFLAERRMCRLKIPHILKDLGWTIHITQKYTLISARKRTDHAKTEACA